MNPAAAIKPARRPWPRSWRSLVVGGLIVVLVVGAVAGWLWFQASMQDQERDREIAYAVAEARRKDVELRQAVKTLDPLMTEGRTVLAEAMRVLGEQAAETTGLTHAVEVAESLVATVQSNPREVSEAQAAVDAALREDQDQLTLVEPVRSSLDSAIHTASQAIARRLLDSATEQLSQAETVLEDSVTVAAGLVTTLQTRIAELNAVLTTPSLPSDGVGSQSVGTPGAEATGKGRASDDAPQPSESELVQIAQREADASEVRALTSTMTALNVAVTRARSLLAQTVDREDIDEVKGATAARAAENTRLTAAIVQAKTDQPELLGEPGSPTTPSPKWTRAE
jgi:uncharacterized membrane protein